MWTREEVFKALDRFIQENGRMPTSKEYKKEYGLPSYETIKNKQVCH